MAARVPSADSRESSRRGYVSAVEAKSSRFSARTCSLFFFSPPPLQKNRFVFVHRPTPEGERAQHANGIRGIGKGTSCRVSNDGTRRLLFVSTFSRLSIAFIRRWAPERLRVIPGASSPPVLTMLRSHDRGSRVAAGRRTSSAERPTGFLTVRHRALGVWNYAEK